MNTDQETAHVPRPVEDGGSIMLVTYTAQLEEALHDLYMQHHGLKHNWCGQWQQCETCERRYAFGWNWTKSDECPYCRARTLIKRELPA